VKRVKRKHSDYPPNEVVAEDAGTSAAATDDGARAATATATRRHFVV
jgi:hypothetical protein